MPHLVRCGSHRLVCISANHGRDVVYLARTRRSIASTVSRSAGAHHHGRVLPSGRDDDLRELTTRPSAGKVSWSLAELIEQIGHDRAAGAVVQNSAGRASVAAPIS